MEASSLARKNLKRNMSYDLNATYNSVVRWIDQMNLETAFLAKMVTGNLKVNGLQFGMSQSVHEKLKESGILNSHQFNDYILTDFNLGGLKQSDEIDRKKFEVPNRV